MDPEVETHEVREGRGTEEVNLGHEERIRFYEQTEGYKRWF